jgi:hypothetical protein
MTVRSVNAGQRPEPRGAHRLPDQHQRRFGARPVPAHIVGQHGAPYLQRVRRQLGHAADLPHWFLPDGLKIPGARKSHRGRYCADSPARLPREAGDVVASTARHR